MWIRAKLLTLTGQPILQTTLAAGEVSKTISVAHLPVGLYLYVVEQQGNVVAREGVRWRCCGRAKASKISATQ